MGKCKDCQYWKEDKSQEVDYGSNFGDCFCDKFVYRENLYDEKCDLDKEKCDNCHIIYSDSEGLYADLKMHKEFGCINFKDKNTYQN